LQHPYILRYYGSIEDRDFLHLVTEYADGGDLQQLLRRQAEAGQALEALVLLAVFAQLAAAVAHVHERQVLHRDLKPSNVLLTTAGLVKLGDFGVAKVMAGTTVCEQMTCVGSPTYMAPEVVGGEEYGPPCDIWSLGVILYELCTLKKPFEARSLGELVLRISSGKYQPLDQIIISSRASSLSTLAVTIGPLLAQMLKVEPTKRVVAAEVTSSPLLALFSDSTSSSSRCIADALQDKKVSTAKLESTNATAKLVMKSNAADCSYQSMADSLSFTRATSVASATRMSASLTQPFDVTATSTTLQPEREEKAIPFANSMDAKCVREVLDGILEKAAPLASSTDAKCVREALDGIIDNSTQVMSDDTLLTTDSKKRSGRRSTAPICNDTLAALDVEQPTLTLNNHLLLSEFELKRRSLSGTAAFVADLQAALVPQSTSGSSTPDSHGLRQRMTGVNARVSSGANHREEVIFSSSADVHSSGSSAPPSGSNSRGHLMNVARSVLASPGAPNNSGARSSEHDKTSTWPVDQKSWKASFDISNFAGRPATPDSIRRQRQDREDLRAVQRSAALTIPFSDGKECAPPAGFLESIRAHETRQKTRRKTKALEESCDDMEVQQETQRPRPSVQHQSSEKTSEGAHAQNRNVASGVRIAVPTLHAPPATVPTIHAPPASHATMCPHKTIQCARRSRSTSATASSGRHAGRGHSIPG